MTFQSPAFLLLLLILPYFIWLGWPRRGTAFWREWISLTLRILLILCLVLGLAGFSLKSPSDQLAVLFLLDISDSIPLSQQTDALAFIQQSMEEKPPDDLAGLIVFGGNALIETPLSTNPAIDEIQSIPTTSQTDIGEAITLAQALFPANTAKRIVLLTDGINTQGSAEEAARVAATNGIEIVSIPLESSSMADAAVTELQLPTQLFEGEEFDLSFTLYSSLDNPATVRVLSGGQVILEQNLQLSVGEESYAIPLVANQVGLKEFSVQVSSLNDKVIQNNQLSGITFVTGPARVLVAAVPKDRLLPNGEARPDEYSALLQALESGNFEYDFIQPELLPAEPAQLVQYSAVVLINIPGRNMSSAQMRSLQSYVRDLGGGLVTIGGPTSYGLGGYYRTPLEETLPIDMRNQDEVRRSTLTLVYVIDHSGSMSDTSGGVSKLDLAKEAAMRSIELLFPRDKVGIIAFDDSASWVSPILEIGDGTEIIDKIGTIRSGGGTDILAGLQAVAEQLPADDAQVRHVILLTDGGADPRGIPELVESLNQEHGITVTSIGIGSDAAPFLQDLALSGGGRYHYVTDPQSIPSIFTEETTLATQSYLVEERFTPRFGTASPILSGISGLPPLNGYVTSSPKDAATVALLSHQGDPILASWQYGLGRSVAFTSDASGRWARDWLSWEGFAPFWGQAISYVASPLNTSTIELDVKTTRGITTLSVNARDDQGGSLNSFDLFANVVSQGFEMEQVHLEQVGAGRYQAEIDALEPGSYAIGLAGSSPLNETEFVERFGWAQSYSSEYMPVPNQQSVLPDIARLAPAGVDVEQIFSHNLEANSALRPVWQTLLTAVALLLLLDIASRRLILSRKDFVSVWEWLKERLVLRKTQAQPEAESVSRVSALQEAKARAQEQHQLSPTETDDPIIIEREKESQVKDAPQPAEEDLPHEKSTAEILLSKKRERGQD